MTEYCRVARSTFYRWLHQIEDPCRAPSQPHNRTPTEVAALVWEIARANMQWGRVRIANQLALLGVFLAASTVRNILNRPEPPAPAVQGGEAAEPPRETEKRLSIPASYPNHVWSIDRTLVSLIVNSRVAANDNGEVICDERLGGQLEYYRRAA